MKSRFGLQVLVIMLGVGAIGTAQAYDSNWKRGRIYYRHVCTACHTKELKKAIGPNERTQAQWSTFMQADRHGKGTVKHFFSRQYRDSIKATNAAAAKFATVPENELLEDVKAFVNRSAKDGDAPAGCS